MKRPLLNMIPLHDFDMLTAGLTLTMSQGQWDGLLEGAYDEGATLLELDDNERPIAAYRKPSVNQ